MRWRRKRQAVRQGPPTDWWALAQRYWQALRPYRRAALLAVAGGGLIAALWASWSALSSDPTVWPVERVFVCRLQDTRCVKLQRADAQAIQRAIQALLQDGMVFVFPGAIRQALSSVAWVKQARVSRHWPGEVRIEIEEYQPVARWWPDATYCHAGVARCAMIDHAGNVFAVKQADWDADLPCLSGPADSAGLVFEQYQTLLPVVQEYRQALRCLHMDARRHWDLTLADGTLLRLGGQALEARLRRFFKVYPILSRDTADLQIAHFDLRYPNGVVVQWR